MISMPSVSLGPLGAGSTHAYSILTLALIGAIGGSRFPWLLVEAWTASVTRASTCIVLAGTLQPVKEHGGVRTHPRDRARDEVGGTCLGIAGLLCGHRARLPSVPSCHAVSAGSDTLLLPQRLCAWSEPQRTGTRKEKRWGGEKGGQQRGEGISVTP